MRVFVRGMLDDVQCGVLAAVSLNYGIDLDRIA